MALEEYKRKRDYKKTPDPPPEKAASHEGFSYLIQRHDATRLHYDLRLELDGILLSWAVTKGPSLNPSDKRLAVRTEDHPLSYGTFRAQSLRARTVAVPSCSGIEEVGNQKAIITLV
jgi:bifunctional non-homologous end joining protein LigD